MTSDDEAVEEVARIVDADPGRVVMDVGGNPQKRYVPVARGACDLVVREGYAVAHVSAPGRGRSTGEWDMFGRRTQRGGYDAVEWFAAQPWSNGKVGLWGISGPAVGPAVVAAVGIPVIGGFGGGPWLDGRVRMAHAAIGYGEKYLDGDVETYANVAETSFRAITELCDDIRAGRQIKGAVKRKQ